MGIFHQATPLSPAQTRTPQTSPTTKKGQILQAL
jgi:hypothetical protein